MPSALVTGGSSGIGLAIARMLAEEGYGLTLASRTADKVEAAAGELDALAVAADVSKPEDCERVVAEHVTRHGGLDVLVNSAGIGIAGRVEDAQLKHIDRQLNINLRGLVLVTQAAIPHLRASQGLGNQPRLDRRHGGRPDPPDLRSLQGRCDLAHEVAQCRPGRRRGSLDRDLPGLRRHADGGVRRTSRRAR